MIIEKLNQAKESDLNVHFEGNQYKIITSLKRNTSYRNKIILGKFYFPDDRLQYCLHFDNCIFIDFHYWDYRLKDKYKGILEVVNSVFVGMASANGCRFENYSIRIEDSCFIGDETYTALNFSSVRGNNLNITLVNNEYNGLHLDFSLMEIQNSRINLDGDVTTEFIDYENSTIDNCKVDLGFSNMRLYMLSFKAVNMFDSELSFYGSTLESQYITFDYSHFKNSSLVFDDYLVRVELGESGVLDSKTELNVDKVSFKNSIIDGSDIRLNKLTGDVKILDFDEMNLKGELSIKDCKLETLKTLSLNNTKMVNGLFEVINFEAIQCCLSIQGATLSGIIKMGDMNFKAFDLRKTLVDGAINVDIFKIDYSFPDYLVIKGGATINYHESKINLKAIFDTVNKSCNDVQNSYLEYWINVFEEKSASKSLIKHPIAYLKHKLYYFVYGRMTNYMLSYKSVLKSAIFTILIFTIVFMTCNFIDRESYLIMNGQKMTDIYNIYTIDSFSLNDFGNIKLSFEYIMSNFYFSIISFTTIGYGDIIPNGWLKLLAAFEGFLGILLSGALLVTIGKKFFK